MKFPVFLAVKAIDPELPWSVARKKVTLMDGPNLFVVTTWKGRILNRQLVTQ